MERFLTHKNKQTQLKLIELIREIKCRVTTNPKKRRASRIREKLFAIKRNQKTKRETQRNEKEIVTRIAVPTLKTIKKSCGLAPEESVERNIFR
jgi:hypothetical protein